MKISLLLSLCVLLFFISEAQVPTDSMPVVKPAITDQSIIIKPGNTTDNMPVVKPDSIPPIEEGTSKKSGGKADIKRKEILQTRKKRN